MALRNLILAVGLGALGIIACQPAAGEDENANVDVDSDGVDPSCVGCTLSGSSSGGIIVVPTAPDADGDGIPDSRDACPNTKGWKDPNKAHYGCPVSYCADVDVDVWKSDKEPGHTRIAIVDGEGYTDCVPQDDLEGKAERCKVPGAAIVGFNKKLNSYLARSGATIERKLDDGSVKYFVVGVKVKTSPIVTKDPYTGQEFTWQKRSVTCTQKPGADVAGKVTAAAGEELASACIVETMGLKTNASGHEHDNYATRTVCSGTASGNPDADSAPISSDATSTCYRAEGAGINDINGTERDVYNQYMIGTDRCHMGWNNNVEVPAAKRPATKGYPVKVDPASPMVWRPVASGVVIAN